jgi:flagellin-like protein
MRKLFRNRKAVSPVIATVLMIMVTMAGMTILFGFVISYSDNYKAGIGSSIMESLVVEDVCVNDGTHVELWIYNCGKLPANVQSIYYNGLSLNVNTFDGEAVSNSLKIDGAIDINVHVKVTATLNPLNYDDTPTIKISTERGSTFEQTYP